MTDIRTPVDAMVDRIGESTFAALATTSPHLRMLMDTLVFTLERYQAGDQAYATALLMGMLWASIEGEQVEAELEMGCLINIEDRMKIWCAVARVAYREAFQARMGHQNPENWESGPV